MLLYKATHMNETFIQLAYFESFQPPFEHIVLAGERQPATEQIQPQVKPNRLTKLSKIFGCIGAALLILYATPKIVNAFVPANTDWVMKQNDMTFDSTRTKNLSYQPAFDSSLPLGNHIQIKKTGLKTDLLEATYEEHEEALREGVWRVDNFGTPDQREKPMILAAHRYGYLAWDNQYRRENSFYNLPKLKNGDVLEVIWAQKKYTYEIYAESEGTEIIDYSADLILYTCVDLNSDIKIFRYARLLEI